MKKLLEYLPFHFLCFLILGIVVQFYLQLWNYELTHLYIFLSVQGIILFLLFRTRIFELLVSFFFFSVGLFVVYMNNDQNSNAYYEEFISDQSLKVLTITRVLKPGNYHIKYEAEVIRIDSISTLGKILVNIQKDSLMKPLEVGQLLHTTTHFQNIFPPFNPHQFDYKRYLAKQGIHRQVFLKKYEFTATNDFEFSLYRWAFQIRTAIQESLLRNGFSGDEYAVINALLLGQRQDISKELRDEYAQAGAIHILAVSGLHVGIILWILNFLLRPLERVKHGKLIKTFLIILLLWAFALVAGLSASVVRAVTMFSAVAIGQIVGRRNATEYSLILSMFLLLLIKPMFLFDVGFQLSYLAVFGIVWIQPVLYHLWKPKWRLIRFYWQLITVSIAAQCGVLPISLFYFHQFPGLFILSNLVIIPFLGVILACGIIVIVLSLCNLLPKFLQITYEFVISWMNQFIQWISQQEGWLLTQISFSIEMLIVSYLVIILGYQLLIHKKVKSLIYFLIGILCFQWVLWFEKWESETQSEWIIFHKSRATILGERTNNTLTVDHDLESASIKSERSLLSYQVGEKVNLELSDSIASYYEFQSIPILVVDQTNFYPKSIVKNPIVLLTNSPKINLERLISELRPKQIIANGSNYKSYVARWKKTCLQTKTPFWHTGQKGAYILN